MKVLIYWVDQDEYVRKGMQGDHNIQFQNNCNHQEYKRATFHTQVVGEKLCQLQDSAWPLMASVQRQVFLT